MGRCKDCRHWDISDLNAQGNNTGRCILASNQYWLSSDGWMFWVSDEVCSHDPFLITKSNFGCVCWEQKSE